MSNDHLAFELNFVNREVSPVANVRARFAQQSAILDKPEDWYMAITKFRFPSSVIPLSNFSIYVQPDQLVSIDDLIMSVTVENIGGGTFHQEYLTFINTQHNAAVPDLPGNYPDGRAPYVDYYNIFSVDAVIAMFNIALANAAAAAGVAAGEEPYFIWDRTERRMSLIDHVNNLTTFNYYYNVPSAQFIDVVSVEGYYGYNAANGAAIKIDRSTYLTDLYPNDDNLYYPAGVVGPDWYIFRSQFSKFPNWLQLHSVVFEMPGMPVSKSLYAIQYAGENADAGNVYIPIAISYDVVSDAVGISPETIYYQLQGRPKLIDLNGASPLSIINLDVYWGDSAGKLHPLQLDINSSFSCTIKFYRRELFGGKR